MIARTIQEAETRRTKLIARIAERVAYSFFCCVLMLSSGCITESINGASMHPISLHNVIVKVAEESALSDEEIARDAEDATGWKAIKRTNPFQFHKDFNSGKTIDVIVTLTNTGFVVSHEHSIGFMFNPSNQTISPNGMDCISDFSDIFRDVLLASPRIENLEYCFSLKGLDAKNLALRWRRAKKLQSDAVVREVLRKRSVQDPSMIRQLQQYADIQTAERIEQNYPQLLAYEREQVAIGLRDKRIAELEKLQFILLSKNILPDYPDDGNPRDMKQVATELKLCLSYYATMFNAFFDGEWVKDSYPTLDACQSERRKYLRDVVFADILSYALDHGLGTAFANCIESDEGQDICIKGFYLSVSDIKHIVDQCRKGHTSVARKETRSTGTGWFVSSNHIATCAHVIGNNSKISCVLFDGTTVPVVLVKKDEANDLALLKLTDMSKRHGILPIVSKPAQMGEKCFTIGYPLPDVLGGEPKYSEGTISSTSGIGEDPRFYQISNPVQPGNSGGPLLNSVGKVIGIVSSRLNALSMLEKFGTIPENVNYAIKVRYLSALLEDFAIEPSNADVAEAIDNAKAATVFVICDPQDQP